MKFKTCTVGDTTQTSFEPPGSTLVEVTLTPDGDGTIVHLRQLGLPDDTARHQHADGWTARLGRLAGVGLLAG